jgi:hypothetical protein
MPVPLITRTSNELQVELGRGCCPQNSRAPSRIKRMTGQPYLTGVGKSSPSLENNRQGNHDVLPGLNFQNPESQPDG